MALCVLHDEIIEFLEEKNSDLAKLILYKYKELCKDIQ